MAIVRNTAEGQSNGTGLTAGNSGGGSGDAFDNVAIVSSTCTFSNTQAMRGAQSYAVTAGASGTVTILWNASSDPSGAVQAYYYLTAYPNANSSILSVYGSGSGTAGLDINSGGRVIVFDAAGTNVSQSANSAVPLNTWIRLDLCSIIGTTTSNGRIQAALSIGESYTPIYSYDSGNTANTGTASISSYRFGKLDSVPTMAVFYTDSLAASPSATTLIPVQQVPTSVSWLGA